MDAAQLARLALAQQRRARAPRSILGSVSIIGAVDARTAAARAADAARSAQLAAAQPKTTATIAYNRELGGWTVNGRGYYATEALAKAAAVSPPVPTGPSSAEFAANWGKDMGVKAPPKNAEERAADQLATLRAARNAMAAKKAPALLLRTYDAQIAAIYKQFPNILKREEAAATANRNKFAAYRVQYLKGRQEDARAQQAIHDYLMATDPQYAANQRYIASAGTDWSIFVAGAKVIAVGAAVIATGGAVAGALAVPAGASLVGVAVAADKLVAAAENAGVAGSGASEARAIINTTKTLAEAGVPDAQRGMEAIAAVAEERINRAVPVGVEQGLTAAGQAALNTFKDAVASVSVAAGGTYPLVSSKSEGVTPGALLPPAARQEPALSPALLMSALPISAVKAADLTARMDAKSGDVRSAAVATPADTVVDGWFVYAGGLRKGEIRGFGGWRAGTGTSGYVVTKDGAIRKGSFVAA